MKIVSFEVSNQKELDQLLNFAKRLGIKLVNKKSSPNLLKLINDQIEKAREDLDKDY
ncbi:MAG: hypothetical protein NW226_26375 [Microscillaceae bacterium]|nr:hypothetical protein [Microscillaceae bacterium]